MDNKLSAALDRADAGDKYEAIVSRRDAALARCQWCDACLDWIPRKEMSEHVKTQGHLDACRKADAWKM